MQRWRERIRTDIIRIKFYREEGEQLENYTKYKLKSSDELASVLDGKDNLFVIACNKCFKEFETVDEPDCGEFLKFAAEQGKTVTGSAKFDFLCNKMHTERKLQDLIPEGTENVVVISCGLGIQTVADLAGKPVVAASNTLNYRGHHGMALTKKSCDACAQCYLNITGGVCPIVDCSKSLVNGQCGGAKNGKCEVDPNKDCAWEKIYQRLAKQGRLEEFLNQPVQVRDFSKVNFKVINLRKSVVNDPVFDRLNTKDNTPAIIHTRIVKGDKIKITAGGKGFGSENMSAIKMLTPSYGIEGVKKFILDTVRTAGPNPCPPIVVGVGIGGTFERCAQLAKKATFRAIDTHNEDERYAKLEDELLESINKMGFGPAGLGGTTTAIGRRMAVWPALRFRHADVFEK